MAATSCAETGCRQAGPIGVRGVALGGGRGRHRMAGMGADGWLALALIPMVFGVRIGLRGQRRHVRCVVVVINVVARLGEGHRCQMSRVIVMVDFVSRRRRHARDRIRSSRHRRMVRAFVRPPRKHRVGRKRQRCRTHGKGGNATTGSRAQDGHGDMLPQTEAQRYDGCQGAGVVGSSSAVYLAGVFVLCSAARLPCGRERLDDFWAAFIAMTVLKGNVTHPCRRRLALLGCQSIR